MPRANRPACHIQPHNAVVPIPPPGSSPPPSASSRPPSSGMSLRPQRQLNFTIPCECMGVSCHPEPVFPIRQPWCWKSKACSPNRTNLNTLPPCNGSRLSTTEANAWPRLSPAAFLFRTDSVQIFSRRVVPRRFSRSFFYPSTAPAPQSAEGRTSQSSPRIHSPAPAN